jgi:hypothetical protein
MLTYKGRLIGFIRHGLHFTLGSSQHPRFSCSTQTYNYNSLTCLQRRIQKTSIPVGGLASAGRKDTFKHSQAIFHVCQQNVVAAKIRQAEGPKWQLSSLGYLVSHTLNCAIEVVLDKEHLRVNLVPLTTTTTKPPAHQWQVKYSMVYGSPTTGIATKDGITYFFPAAL